MLSFLELTFAAISGYGKDLFESTVVRAFGDFGVG
jgi:hypothetical protein